MINKSEQVSHYDFDRNWAGNQHPTEHNKKGENVCMRGCFDAELCNWPIGFVCICNSSINVYTHIFVVCGFHWAHKTSIVRARVGVNVINSYNGSSQSR